MISQRVHDALIAILREHQPKGAAALLIDLEELIVRELAAEREACAQACEELTNRRAAEMGLAHYDHLTGHQCSAAIRARTEGSAE